MSSHSDSEVTLTAEEEEEALMATFGKLEVTSSNAFLSALLTLDDAVETMETMQ